ncbi:MAG: RHS repeat protein [Kiritimatiellae bacterium]|nr:RHS repeat protein [Kiritimatiellia bacterium]
MAFFWFCLICALADTANQLQAQTALGVRRIIGTVDKPSHVKVNDAYVPVDENLRFEALVDTFLSRNVIIKAKDISENVTTPSYRFAEPQNTAGVIHRLDANGRLVEVEHAEKKTTYAWDALGRLLMAEVMARDGSEGKRNTYGYDPLSRMTRMETEIWDGSTWTLENGNAYVYKVTRIHA